MDIKTRLTRCCGKPIGGDNCREGMRCSDCFDKLEGLREIERLREALQKIYWATKEPEMDRIAGAALQQKDSQ